jgi:putative FmdB family regulatory protein
MPTYDYACEKCNNIVEIFHSMFDKTEKKCEECGTILIKQISVPTMVIEKGRTIGAIAEENTKRALKEGKIPPGHEKKPPRPWYRPKDKINKDILKNPQKYIRTGEV